jgi:hypothetical protein
MRHGAILGSAWVCATLAACVLSPDETAQPRPTSSAAPAYTNGSPPVQPEPAAPAEASSCVLHTCAALGHPCGQVPDGCGGVLTCGSCLEGQTCGGAGFNVCGMGTCVALTCEQAAANCGDISDGCGKVVACGQCGPGSTCNQNQCSCTPTTCQAKGANCGELSDGCGTVLDCGSCVPGHMCTNNVCTCTPGSCAAVGAWCGDISDGCGNVLNCGTCPPGESCINHACCKPSEVCGNGKDDNCNGKIDENCTVGCEATEGDNCNDDAGYGNHCAPSDNIYGCTAERFFAWCNRRNDKYPDIWDNYLAGWVDARCDGNVKLVQNFKGTYPAYVCTNSDGATFTCTTPLVLAFDSNQPVRMEPAAHSFLLAPGSIPFEWPTAATPWLAMDRNGNGRIDDATELFGSAERNGFELLASLDSNRDAVLDQQDCGWGRLLVWRDENGNGLSEPEELVPAAREGLLGISLQYTVQARCDARGNCERERAEFRWVDAAGKLQAGAVIDVYLRVRPATD